MNNTNLNQAKLEQAYFKGSFDLNVNAENKAKGNSSESYINNKYITKDDDDGFDTFVLK